MLPDALSCAAGGISANLFLVPLVSVLLLLCFSILVFVGASARPASRVGLNKTGEATKGLFNLPLGPRCSCRRCEASRVMGREEGVDGALEGRLSNPVAGKSIRPSLQPGDVPPEKKPTKLHTVLPAGPPVAVRANQVRPSPVGPSGAAAGLAAPETDLTVAPLPRRPAASDGAAAAADPPGPVWGTPRARGPCLWGRFLEYCDDEESLLRLLLVMTWVFLPIAVASTVAFLGVVGRDIRDGRPLPTVQLALGLVVAAAVFAGCMAPMGLAVMVSRVTSRQRDRMLLDMVPKDVARALLLDDAKERANKREDKARATRLSRHGNALGTARSGIQGFMSITKSKISTVSKGAASRTKAIGFMPELPVVSSGLDGSEGPGRKSMPRRHSDSPAVSTMLPAPDEEEGSSRASGVVFQSVEHDGTVFFDGPTAFLTEGGVLDPPRYHKELGGVSIMFSDLVGFTGMSSAVSPVTVFALLNSLFGVLDRVTEHLGIRKYETVGDAYITMASHETSSTGAFETPELSTLRMAVAVVQATSCYRVALPGGAVWQARARVGVNLGPATYGVVGKRRKLACIIGDTINMASRMETNSSPGCVLVSAPFHDHLPEPMQALFQAKVVLCKGVGAVPAFLLDVEAQAQAIEDLGLGLIFSGGDVLHGMLQETL